MSDERLNLPSASGLERLALCPASRTLELSQPDKRSDESALGDDAHDLAAKYFRALAAAGEMPDGFPWPPMPPAMYAGLDINLADVVERFIHMANEVYGRWAITLPAFSTPQIVVEERITWSDAKFNPMTTGKPDIVFVCGKHGLVLDLKSLNGEQTESVRNIQLGCYAVLVNEEHGCTEITVAICQPRVSQDPQTCIYEPESIIAARLEILAYLKQSEQPDAPLVAGKKQCKFCRARAVCPAAAEYARLSEVSVIPERPLVKGEAARIVELLTVPQRIALWEKSGTVSRILDAVKENLLELPADELATHGLEVVVSKGDRQIKDGPGAWEKLNDILKPEAWNACCSVAISKLENAVRAAKNLPVKETKALLETRLGDLISRKADGRALSYNKAGPVPPTQPTLELTAPASTQ